MRPIDAENLNFENQKYNKSQMQAILDFIDNQPTIVEQPKDIPKDMGGKTYNLSTPNLFNVEGGRIRAIDLDRLVAELKNENTMHELVINIPRGKTTKETIDITIRAYRKLLFDAINEQPIIEVPWPKNRDRWNALSRSISEEANQIVGYQPKYLQEWNCEPPNTGSSVQSR